MEKRTYQGTRIHTHHRQTHHRTNLIFWRIEIPVNQLNRKFDKKKNCRKHRKDDSSDPSSSNDSDSADDSDYRRKRHKEKSHHEKDTIKLCACLTEKLLTTAYKLNIISFKMNEDQLQRRIYFLTFLESLEMIFSQYKETCEVLLDYPKIGGENIKSFSRKAITNICMTILMCTEDD